MNPEERASIEELRAVTQERVSRFFHSQGIERLLEIAASQKDRDALTALHMIGTITGDLTSRHEHRHRVTFDDLRKRQGSDPLTALFDVRPVVEAALED